MSYSKRLVIYDKPNASLPCLVLHPENELTMDSYIAMFKKGSLTKMDDEWILRIGGHLLPD